jgi:hypothetical protein
MASANSFFSKRHTEEQMIDAGMKTADLRGHDARALPALAQDALLEFARCRFRGKFRGCMGSSDSSVSGVQERSDHCEAAHAKAQN